MDLGFNLSLPNFRSSSSSSSSNTSNSNSNANNNATNLNLTNPPSGGTSPNTSFSNYSFLQLNKINYCLYKKDIERELSHSARLDSTREGEEVEVHLEVEYTNLDVKEESNLRKYVQHKVNRKLIFSQTGQIGILPTFEPTKTKHSSTTLCYYSMIEVKEKNNPSPSPQQSVENLNQIQPQPENEGKSNEDKPKILEYILCLICELESDEGFALFRPDLDLFCVKLKRLLMEVKFHGKDDNELRDNLESWYTYTIEHITRCVDTVKDKLPVVLHSALIGKPIIIAKGSERKTFVEDITKFIRAASLNQLSDQSNVIIGDDREFYPNGIIISLDSSFNFQISSKETNVFCREWAKEIRKSAKTLDPFKLRNLMEHYKLKVIQELNQLKRLVEHAKISNYALYKAYSMLKKNSASDVLLTLILQDKSDSSIIEVVQVIESYFAKQMNSSELK